MKDLLNHALASAGVKSQIARNSAFLLFAEGFARVINLLLQIVLARYLGAKGVGILAFVTNYAVIFTIIAELGITRVAIRDIAAGRRSEAGRILGTVIFLRMILGSIMMLVIWLTLLTPLGRDATTNYLIFLFSWSLFFQAWRRNSDIIFYSFERMKYAAVFQIANRLVAASIIFTGIYLKAGLVFVITAYVIADMMEALAASWFVGRRVQKPEYRTSWAASSRLLIAGLPFALHSLAAHIYFYIDVVLLKFWHPDKDAVDAVIGNYSRAYQVVLTLLFLPMSLCNAIFPSLARAHSEDDHARSRSLFGYSYGLMLLGGWPLGAAFFLFRTEFMTMVFGPEFYPGASMLAIVIWTLPLVFLTMPIGNLFAATNRQGYVTAVALANVVFNIGLNWFLIPKHGGHAAAFATTASEVFALLLLAAIALHFYRGLFALRVLLPIVAFHCVALAVVFANDGASWPVRAGVAFAYCGLAIAGARELWARRQREAA